MAEESLKDKTAKGLVWSCIERFSMQGIQFLVTIVLARLLTPNDYGLVGMLSVFLAVAQSLIDSGFSQALIRKTDKSDIDCDTVLWFNVVISIIIYFVLFFSAPYIAFYFKEPYLCKILRTLGIVVIINGSAVVQRALFIIDINFKLQTKATLLAAVLSGTIGIYMAYTGYGVWALVCQQIVNSLVTTLFLWFYSLWRPKFLFSVAAFREMFSFGSKLLISGLVNTVYNNIYQLTIGKVFNAATLGYYTRSQQFAQLPSVSLTDVFQRVLYPVLCKIQDDKERYRIVFVKFLRTSAFVIFPIMCLLAGISRPLILILLGEKWLFAATLLVPLSLAAMLYPMHALNLNVITVIGRSDLFLKVEIYKKIIGVLILTITIPLGVTVMCYGSILGSLLALVINTHYTKREIDYGLFAQIKDLLPITLLSSAIFAQAYLISFLVTNSWLSLIVSCIIGFILALFCIYVFNFKEIEYIKSFIRND